MTDRGSTAVEAIIAVTVLGVGGIAILGALQALTTTSSASAQRSTVAVALLSAVAVLTDPCTSGVGVVEATPLEPCSEPGPRRVRLSAGSGSSHRHLTVVVDGGP